MSSILEDSCLIYTTNVYAFCFVLVDRQEDKLFQISWNGVSITIFLEWMFPSISVTVSLRFVILNDFELNDFEKFYMTQFSIQYVFEALYLPFLCYTYSLVVLSSSTTVFGEKPQELTPSICSLRYGIIGKVQNP